MLALAATPAVAGTGAPLVSAPASAAVGQPFAVTVTVPRAVAALEGRVLVADGAAEVIGVAPVRTGRAFRPATGAGGAAFGVYDLAAGADEVTLRVVLEPQRAGRLQVRVAIDAAADRRGRRVSVGATVGTAVVRVGGDSRLLAAPATSAAEDTAPAARKLADPVPDGIADSRDVDAVRGDWEDAHYGEGACATTDGDVNGDGCVDIVDVQAVLAADLATADPRTLRDTGTTYTVNSTGDAVDAVPGNGVCATAGGVCTLRAAITEANWNAAADRIHFSLAGAAPVSIQLGSSLPDISSHAGGLTIDAYTQPGSQVNTASVGSNAVAGVEIRGGGPGAQWPLMRITSADNTIRGLLMNTSWRAIALDSAAATRNRIVGNLIGYTRTGAAAPTKGEFGIVLNEGSNANVIGTPALADRNVIGMQGHAIENYGPGVYGNVIQNNLFCITPSGFTTATCDTAVDHNFGPKGNLIGGFGPNERNIVGPTNYQAIEMSHGWDPRLEPREVTTLEWQVNDHRVLGNWLGFRADGSYDSQFVSGSRTRTPTSDNGNGVNVIDGASFNLVEGNVIASRYDGVQVMAPNTTGNIIRGNVIGQSPLGQAAPLSGWGVKVRWGTKSDVIEGNAIRNAALGGIGLVQETVYEIRISRNVVTDTAGPAIDLYGVAGPDVNDTGDLDGGANTVLNTPVVTSATTAAIGGTAGAGFAVEVYRASGAVGQFGLPVEYLGTATAAANGTWSVPVALTAGDRITTLGIRPDQNTSELSANVAVTQAVAPPDPEPQNPGNGESPEGNAGPIPTTPGTSGGGSTAVPNRAPVVRPLAAATKRGVAVKLRFRVTDDHRKTREVITVYTKGGRLKVRIKTKLRATVPNRVYTVSWRVPKLMQTGAGKFCVQAFDQAGARSKNVCAPLRVKK